MDVDVSVKIFFVLGVLFLIGLATDLLGKMTSLPRVTLLLVIGFIAGPSGLAWLPDMDAGWVDTISKIALVMVGFLLGEHLTMKKLRKRGVIVLSVSITVTLLTILVVGLGLILLGVNLELALLLAAMSTATAPAAMLDVAHEVKAKGPFTSALLGVVAVDDVWGLLIFSFVLTLIASWSGSGGGLEAVTHGLMDIGGAMAVGIGLGIPMSLLTGRLRPGQPTQAEALGFVFICAGVAMWLDVSFILASIMLGMTVANLANHHKRAFHEIEGIEWPFLILFFLLAGASLELDAVEAGGMLLMAYVLLRILGRVSGGWLGGWLASAPPSQRRWFGLALLPQAGVAIGMALVGAQRFPEHAEQLLTIAIAATVFFELLGPIFTRLALQRQHEIHLPAESSKD